MFNSIIEMVGNTPLLYLKRYQNFKQLHGNLYGKLEYLNPAGSIKDRVAKGMLLDALNKGKINLDTTIIEATSGNTGIGLAAIGASLGLKVMIIMPETMTIERRKLIAIYGAKIILTDGKLGIKGAIQKANELHQSIENSYIISQFDNPQNPLTHYQTTAVELEKQVNGPIDVLIAGAGTGGTISGLSHYLKEKYPNIEVVAVEPKDSAVLSGQAPGKHKLAGIGPGFIAPNLDIDCIDRIITIDHEEAFQAVHEFAKSEGVLVGISSGAALVAAIKVMKDQKYENKNIVVILPDGGSRYLSTDLFDNL